jgi:hypothetical protein
MPTCPRATSEVRRAKPVRSTRPPPETPDDGHLIVPPTQGDGSLDETILAIGGFAVVLDLCAGRLADVDARTAM